VPQLTSSGFVIPEMFSRGSKTLLKAFINAIVLDSRQKIAGMTGFFEL